MFKAKGSSTEGVIEVFGPHLMLDCYGCPKKKLSDVNFVAKFLDALPDTIGMTKIMPPYVFQYSGLKPEDWGVSGIVLIAESHISIHTFADKGFATIDIYSCKDFDVETAAEYIVSAIGAQRYEKNFMMRGREFPKDIMQASKIIEKQRSRL